jgi:succinoglycan biosynthesis protein ExoM
VNAVNVSVCIATYRRPERLDAVLTDLSLQTVLPDQVVVVDNDSAGSARPVVERHAAGIARYALEYDIQPERNIALTRNRTVELAAGQWLAFIDDDERAPPRWLETLLESARENGADGVLGPVIPEVPESAPRWIRAGRFYDFPRMTSGAAVPLNRMRFGNILLRGEPLRTLPGPFDTSYGLSTGEDGDMLIRLVDRGARVIWCDEAVVHEPIEPKRLHLRWLLQRALSGGQEFALKSMRGRFGRSAPFDRLRLLLRALAQLCLAACLAVVCLPSGRHHSARWLIAAWANAGKLSALFGWRYREYA